VSLDRSEIIADLHFLSSLITESDYKRVFTVTFVQFNVYVQ